jgi:hypothetical protein
MRALVTFFYELNRSAPAMSPLNHERCGALHLCCYKDSSLSIVPFAHSFIARTVIHTRTSCYHTWIDRSSAY